MDLQIDQEEFSPSAVALRLSGRLNVIASPGLKGAIQAAADAGAQAVIVDMADVIFMDSSGMAALVYGLKTMRAGGGTLVLVSVGQQARTALRISRLDTVFSLFDEMKDARAAVGAG
jgi:anti-sigma B factor antagonist